MGRFENTLVIVWNGGELSDQFVVRCIVELFDLPFSSFFQVLTLLFSLSEFQMVVSTLDDCVKFRFYNFTFMSCTILDSLLLEFQYLLLLFHVGWVVRQNPGVVVLADSHLRSRRA